MANNQSWVSVLETLQHMQELSADQAQWAMNEMIAGTATSEQISSFLLALNAKGETVNEVIGFREAILAHAVPLEAPSEALDIVGTGGDSHHTINISTTAAVIAAASGVPVIKHGNRAASSSSGSSDVLNALGLNLDLQNHEVADLLYKEGITFAFASAFHPGFKNVGPTRSELGVPTVFNILGPLCNPARPEASAVGVAQLERVPLIVGVFRDRGATAVVFRGDDGLDEITTTTTSRIWEISQGQVYESLFDPQNVGISLVTLEELKGGTPQQNAKILTETLSGKLGPVRDIVLLNAAAGLVAYDLYLNPENIDTPFVDRMRLQLSRAAQTIDSGVALDKLESWIEASNAF